MKNVFRPMNANDHYASCVSQESCDRQHQRKTTAIEYQPPKENMAKDSDSEDHSDGDDLLSSSLVKQTTPRRDQIHVGASAQQQATASTSSIAIERASDDSSQRLTRGEKSTTSCTQGDSTLIDIQSTYLNRSGNDSQHQHQELSLLHHSPVHLGQQRRSRPFQNQEETSLTNRRQPCYNITETSVCFESPSHPGTIMWHDIVTDMAINTEDYPDWDDSIPDLVRDFLAEEGSTRFLVFLTNVDHQPCTDVTIGSWFPATEQEFFQKTMERFFYTVQID
jgi:hypothetical protein